MFKAPVDSGRLSVANVIIDQFRKAFPTLLSSEERISPIQSTLLCLAKYIAYHLLIEPLRQQIGDESFAKALKTEPKWVYGFKIQYSKQVYAHIAEFIDQKHSDPKLRCSLNRYALLHVLDGLSITENHSLFLQVCTALEAEHMKDVVTKLSGLRNIRKEVYKPHAQLHFNNAVRYYKDIEQKFIEKHLDGLPKDIHQWLRGKDVDDLTKIETPPSQGICQSASSSSAPASSMSPTTPRFFRVNPEPVMHHLSQPIAPPLAFGLPLWPSSLAYAQPQPQRQIQEQTPPPDERMDITITYFQQPGVPRHLVMEFLGLLGVLRLIDTEICTQGSLISHTYFLGVQQRLCMVTEQLFKDKLDLKNYWTYHSGIYVRACNRDHIDSPYEQLMSFVKLAREIRDFQQRPVLEILGMQYLGGDIYKFICYVPLSITCDAYLRMQELIETWNIHEISNAYYQSLGPDFVKAVDPRETLFLEHVEQHRLGQVYPGMHP